MKPVTTPFADPDDASEAFEAAWDSGMPPDLVAFVDRLKPKHRRRGAYDLIEIDVERRWRSDSRVTPRSILQYQRLLTDRFLEAETVALVCWEYTARNCWGDCITRPEIFRKYERLGRPLLRELRTASARIAWPVVAVAEEGTVTMETVFDRPIEVGRQHVGERGPWAIRTNFLRRRLVLDEYTNPEFSRNQLSLKLVSPTSVFVRNMSHNRPVQIRNRRSLLPDERIRLELPFLIRLGKTRYLRVCRVEQT